MINGEKLFKIAEENDLLYSGGSSDLKHFNFISNYINENENVVLAFSVNSVYAPNGKVIWGGIVACVITEDRIIYGQKGLLGGYKAVELSNLNDITKTNFGILELQMILDTYKEKIIFGVPKKKADNYINKVSETVYQLKQKYSKQPNSNNSVADELLKFKQLLDMNAITQEEFDKKKKELLG